MGGARVEIGEWVVGDGEGGRRFVCHQYGHAGAGYVLQSSEN